MRHLRVIAGVLAAAAALGATAVGVAAPAEERWAGTPTTLAPVGNTPALAAGADGTTVAVWVGEDDLGRSVLEGSVQEPAQAPGPRQLVGACSTSLFGGPITPQVAVAANGAAVAAWVCSSDVELTHIMVAVRAPGAPFGAPVTAASAGSYPAVAIDPTGGFTVVWSEGADDEYVVRAMSGRADGTLEAAVTVGAGSDPDVAVAADGTTTVVWAERPAGQSSTLWSARREPGGAFATPEAVANDLAELRAPKIAAAGGGEIFVVWRQNTAYLEDTLRLRRRPPGGPFAASQVLRVGEITDFAVEVAPDGTGLIAWTRFLNPANSDLEHVVETSVVVPGASALPAVTRSDESLTVHEFAIGVGNGGRSAVVWTDYLYPYGALRQMVSIADGTGSVSTPEEAPESAGDQGQVAFLPNGSAVLVWRAVDAHREIRWLASDTDPPPPDPVVTTTEPGPTVTQETFVTTTTAPQPPTTPTPVWPPPVPPVDPGASEVASQATATMPTFVSVRVARRGVSLPVTCSAACSLSAVMRVNSGTGARTVAHGAVALRQRGSSVVQLRLTAQGRRLAARLHGRRATLTIRDRTSGTPAITARVRLVR